MVSKTIKLLMLLTFISTLASASVPIRDENGCMVGSAGAESGSTILQALNIKEDRVAIGPLYLLRGKTESQTIINHPYDRPDFNCPPIVHEKTELLLPFTGRLVGHIEHVFSDIYLTVPTPNEVKYFPFNDVYVESTQSWDFKEFRGELK